ncbi:hypothetical protein GPJ56_004871 [Histomonas meleagridis]|uniref:uncharacterized protein n=1 Tax=Histomonas meleagridis TaxID=135588 RepID=UPI00355AAF06|nr:hypothetical protein GPJ56_004871 [Histomonas meleagridis]KAH0803521.1 hypothetical protein GO595_003865 [Histomonas meleagridis]
MQLNQIKVVPNIDQNMIFSKFNKITEDRFREIANRLYNLETRFDSASHQIADLQNKIENRVDDPDLIDRINELEEQVQELLETDATPKLSGLMARVNELEEENQRLRNYN